MRTNKDFFKNSFSQVFGMVLRILTSFRVLRVPQSWWKYFLSRFQPLFIFNIFHAWNQEKTFKKFEKICFTLLLKAGPHANAGQLPKGVPQIRLVLVDLYICLFSIFLFIKKLIRIFMSLLLFTFFWQCHGSKPLTRVRGSHPHQSYPPIQGVQRRGRL